MGGGKEAKPRHAAKEQKMDTLKTGLVTFNRYLGDTIQFFVVPLSWRRFLRSVFVPATPCAVCASLENLPVLLAWLWQRPASSPSRTLKERAPSVLRSPPLAPDPLYHPSWLLVESDHVAGFAPLIFRGFFFSPESKYD